MVIGNLLSALAPSIELLAPCRFLSGLGAAMVIVAESRAAARLANSGLAFGFMASARALFGIVGYLLFYGAMGWGGLPSIYLTLAAIAAIMLPLSRLFAKFGEMETRNRGIWPDLPRRQWLFAFSLLVYYIGHAALWAYVNRIGIVAGLEGHIVALALSVSSATGFLGAMLATVWSARFPAVTGLALAIAAGMVGAGLLFASGTAMIFAVGVAAVSLSSSMAGALYLGTLASDRTGEDGVTAGALAFSLAWTAGPMLGAAILDIGGYFWVVAFMFGLTALAAVPVVRRLPKGDGQAEQA